MLRLNGTRVKAIKKYPRKSQDNSMDLFSSDNFVSLSDKIFCSKKYD